MKMKQKNSLVPSNARRITGMVIRYTLAVLVTVIMVFPLFWMLSTALKTEQEVMSAKLVFWPKVIQWDNFAYPFRKVPFLRYVLNTACVTASVCGRRRVKRMREPSCTTFSARTSACGLMP